MADKPMNHFQLAQQCKTRLERVFPVRPSAIVQVANGSAFDVFDGERSFTITVSPKDGDHYD